MCGITGFISFEEKKKNLREIAIQMSKKLLHRGPDDEDVWVDLELGVALAHRRLSIVDLSKAGRQPMISECGRFCIVFNGEVYNHLSIRDELPSPVNWRGHSDTETIVNSIAQLGLEKTLRKVVGMFAFAVWDKYLKKLTLACDRMGEKPIYYGFKGENLIFGSELKAINAFPNLKSKISMETLAMYINLGYIPAPHSIYEGIYKMMPGNFIEFSLENIESKKIPESKAYWSLESIIKNRGLYEYRGSEKDAIDNLDFLLNNSISGQLLGDVPIGCFLSGGIDSATVVSLLQNQTSNIVNTFTIGFDEAGFDESKKAKSIASFLGTNHNEFFVSPKDALATIPKLSSLYDEPFADVSQIPTYILSEFSSSKVKVCLSGDGGDELFCGYNRHIVGPKIWGFLKYLPFSIRLIISNFIKSIPPSSWDKFYNYFETYLPKYLKVNSPGLKLQKISDLINVRSLYEVYLSLLSSWENPNSVVKNTSFFVDSSKFEFCKNNIKDPHHQIMFMDTIGYLPYDILVKIDRAAMSNSLETRLPLLDHRVVEFAWQMPLNMKLRKKTSKWLLRQVLKKYLPDNLIDGPKKGFSVPISDWLRGPLKEWANTLLDPSLIYSQNYFNVDLINKKWHQHLSGKHDWSSQLWTILVFQSWLNEI